LGLSEILIGIFTAAFLMFLRNANVVAQRQKIVSTQLDAYLRYWRRVVLDNDWFKLFYFGVAWNKEEKEIMQKGGNAEDLVKLKEEKKEFLEIIQEKLESDDSELQDEFRKMLEKIGSYPGALFDKFASSISTRNQNLIEGKTFISDADASHLDPYIASTCIDLKMKMVSMAESASFLLSLIAANPREFDVKNHSTEVSEIFWQLVLISKDIDSLSTAVESYTGKSVLNLTLENVGL
jgi:hypothetical protein